MNHPSVKPSTVETIRWNSGSNLSDNTFQLYGKQDTVEEQSQLIFLEKGTLSNLTVKLTSEPGIGNSRKFTVRLNGVDTSLDVIIADNATSGSNNIDQVQVNELDCISLVHTSTNNEGLILPSVGISGLKFKQI